MWAKILLLTLCMLMVGAALHFDSRPEPQPSVARSINGANLRLLTWNIGYPELEDDTRAHTQDLKAVAETILHNDPDAVALQELSGAEQLKILLGYLHDRYTGAVTHLGNTDRVEAVLVKDHNARFENIPAGDKYALAATFHLRRELPEVVLVSAHADAFKSSRRRAFTGDLVDWTRARPSATIVFVAGDFNFEVDSRDQSHFYTDNLKHDSEAYSYLLKYSRDLGRDAGKTAINDRRIDYIFGREQTVEPRRAEVLRSAAVGRMDHWPLLVEVAL